MNDNKYLYTKAIWYLVIATISLLLINIFSIARFSSLADSSTSLSIAIPIIELTTEETELSDLDSDGEDISFSVKNYNADGCSDVALNYTICFETEDETPIICKLYRIDGEDREECSLSSNISSTFSLPHSVETTNNYIVNVSINDVNYKNSTDNLKIIINAEQNM